MVMFTHSKGDRILSKAAGAGAIALKPLMVTGRSLSINLTAKLLHKWQLPLEHPITNAQIQVK
jgi:hypothetical protein